MMDLLLEVDIEQKPSVRKLLTKIVAFICALGLATIWIEPAASAKTCTGSFNRCLALCTAHRGGLTAGLDGCANACQHLMNRCLRTGCYTNTKCGFGKS
jgi:hypothetical protein